MKSDSYLLGINLAIGKPGVGLWRDGAKLTETRLDRTKQASDSLLIEIDQLVKDAGIELNHLDEMICIAGPGGYTGIRVSIATVLGFKRSLKCRINGYNAFDVMLSEKREGEQSALIDAGRNEYLVFNKNKNDPRVPQAMKVEEIAADFEGSRIQLIASVKSFALLKAELEPKGINVFDCSDNILDRLYGLHISRGSQHSETITPYYGRHFGKSKQ